MDREAITAFVEAWTVGWTAVLAVGYLAELTPWRRLTALRSPSAAKLMLLSSIVVVFVLTLADAGKPVTVLTTWAIVFSSLNWLFHYFRSLE